jgi:hypothetical protein
MIALRHRIGPATFRRAILCVLTAVALGAMPAAADPQADRIDKKEALEAARSGNFKRALSELLPLARGGDAEAAYAVADLYRSGRGVKQDFGEAAKWYRAAANQSHPVAQYNLAVLYTVGRGVPADFTEARHWFRLSAEQGYARAQYNLAVLHAAGKGGPADFVLAYQWFDLAAAQGSTEAAKNRDQIEKEMTKAQVAAAKELVRKWREQRKAEEKPG